MAFFCIVKFTFFFAAFALKIERLRRRRLFWRRRRNFLDLSVGEPGKPLFRPQKTPCAAFCSPQGKPLVQHFDPLFSLYYVKKGFIRPQISALECWRLRAEQDVRGAAARAWARGEGPGGEPELRRAARAAEPRGGRDGGAVRNEVSRCAQAASVPLCSLFPFDLCTGSRRVSDRLQTIGRRRIGKIDRLPCASRKIDSQKLDFARARGHGHGWREQSLRRR